MGSGLIRRPRACVEHPHRPAVDRCDACGRGFCAECLVRGGAQLLCRVCTATIAEREAGAPQRRSVVSLSRVARRISAWRGAVVAIAVVLGFGGAVCLGLWRWTSAHPAAPAGLGGADAADLPGVAERIAVERYCTGGEGTLAARPEPGEGSGTDGTLLIGTGGYVAEITNALPVIGGVAAATPSPVSAGAGDVVLPDPMTLVRNHGPNSLGWRSASAVLPQQVGYALRREVILDRASFWHTPRWPLESWARDVVLLVSTTSPDQGFHQAGQFRLAQTTAVQTFSFVAVRARYVRLCLLTRHGSADLVALGGFGLGVLTGTVIPDSRPAAPVQLGATRP